jgi:predicted lysophospholipase L1 biosynthesis ABC-type transport system permease subunit
MNDPSQDLSEIRTMMEKSSKVLSLSGLAGIVIGCVALAGVLFAQYIQERVPSDQLFNYLFADAILVLIAAIGLAVIFSSRIAKQKGLPIWNATARHLVSELAIPLAAGGVFCASLLVHKVFVLLPSAMLVFYGLALFSASKYTVKEVRILGLTQLAIGMLAAFVDTQGLNLWALGFGIGHIVFGVRVYFTYER